MNYFKLLVISAILAVFVLQGCKNDNYDSQLNEALAYAGSNRHQLELVLDHYRGDSIGLESAKFLIRNMPGHYSYADTATVNRFYDRLDSLNSAMKNCSLKELQEAIKDLCEVNHVDQFPTIDDVRIISATFLIDNIDGALRQWREKPWCDRLDFDQFCEYILPYKTTELQELKSWRNEYDNYFADSLERISSCSLYRISAFQAAETVNNCLKQYFSRDPYDYEIPLLYYRPLSRLAIPFATCDELCNTGLPAFRAAGIPVALDNVPVWGYGNRGHSWAVVHAPNGKDIPFVPIDGSPYTTHKVNETVGKAYRRTFAQNRELVELNATQPCVPEVFRNIFQRDVTTLYADTRRVSLDVDLKNGDYIYLCSSSRATWRPVDFTKVTDGKAVFEDVGKGCIYLPAIYGIDGLVPVGEPFAIERNGHFHPIVANCDSLIDVTLYRKAPLLEYAWRAAVRCENGVFEASDSRDFGKPIHIGEINASVDKAGEIAIEPQIGPHRYWRFIGRGDDAVCSIGEISLIRDGVVINRDGKVSSNIKVDSNLKNAKPDKAFDGDVLTAVTFTHPGEAWVALEFTTPVCLDKIRYSPRSDGNMIEPGDEYELVYWSDGDWCSLGKQTADGISITFHNIPSDGIYILHNRTKGSSVRIFRIDKEGNQEWW